LRKITVICCILFLICSVLNAQIITTFAGGGSGGDGIPATASALPDPGGCFFSDKGDLYVCSGTGNKIRFIDSLYNIHTFAGNGIGGYLGDGGSASSALLNFPAQLTYDSKGNIYFTDFNNEVIRKIDISTGIITTFCGNGTAGSSGDNGPATSAQLNAPNGICFDQLGNFYIADNSNNKIRVVDSSGIIFTFAGTGAYGFSGDDSLAEFAKLWGPTDVTSDDSGNIYIADQGNLRIRKVDRHGIITTFAGNGIGTYIGEGMVATTAQIVPTWLKFDGNHNLFLSSYGTGNYRVYKIDTNNIIWLVAGNGSTSFSGDYGSATDASLKPGGLTFDNCGNLYISDIDNNRIRKVTYDSTCDPYTTKAPQLVQSQITIYPNPTSNSLHIDGIESVTEYGLFNIIGIIEQSGVFQKGSNELPISTLPTGMYLLQLTDEQGRKTMKKVVKE